MQIPKVVTSVTQRSGGQVAGTQARAICWRLRANGDQAACALYLMPSGWLLRMEINGTPRRAEEFATQQEWISAAVQWKSAMLQEGWREAFNSAPPRSPLSVAR